MDGGGTRKPGAYLLFWFNWIKLSLIGFISLSTQYLGMEVFNNAFDNKHVITIKTILAKYSNGDLPVKSTEVYFINRSIYIIEVSIYYIIQSRCLSLWLSRFVDHTDVMTLRYNRRTASQPSHVVRQNLQKRKLRVLNPARIHVFYWWYIPG